MTFLPCFVRYPLLVDIFMQARENPEDVSCSRRYDNVAANSIQNVDWLRFSETWKSDSHLQKKHTKHLTHSATLDYCFCL